MENSSLNTQILRSDDSSNENQLTYEYIKVKENEFNLADNNSNIYIVKPRIDNIIYDKKEYKEVLINLIKSENFESGIITESERYFEALLLLSQDIAQITINDIHYNAVLREDYHTISGVLFILAHMDYQKVCPVGPTIAAASLSLLDKGVVRDAIMAFEYWKDANAIKYFEKIRVESKWINNYKTKVINRMNRSV